MAPGIANDPLTVIQNRSRIFNFIRLSLSKKSSRFSSGRSTNSEQLNQPLDLVAALFEEIEAILRYRLGFKHNAPP